MDVCVCVCVCVRVHVYVYACIHVLYVWMCACDCIHLCDVCIAILLHNIATCNTYTCVRVCLHTLTHFWEVNTFHTLSKRQILSVILREREVGQGGEENDWPPILYVYVYRPYYVELKRNLVSPDSG